MGRGFLYYICQGFESILCGLTAVANCMYVFVILISVKKNYNKKKYDGLCSMLDYDFV